ncbi:MAG: hypothetical protein WDZ45_13530 [Flavobacteriaceae bacterium]
MDSKKIEQLLDAYFEGTTSIAEEKLLQEYFKSGEVAPHLEVYQDMFAFFATAKSEKTSMTPEISETNNQPFYKSLRKWVAVAALLVVALGVTFFINNNSNKISTAEQREAELAFEKTKEALNFISYQFNSSAQNLTVVKEFGKSTNKIFK